MLRERAEYIGTATNNVAEYRGLIAGLEAVRELDPAATVEARLDSKLVVEQMSGRWKIKHPDMRALALRAREVLPPSQVTYTWVPRERNKHADRLANEALDAAARGQAWSPRRQHRRAATARTPAATRPSAEPTPRARLVGWDAELGTPTTTVLLRHGETAHTVGEAVQRVRRGATPSSPRRGSRQAAARAERLAATGGVDAVVARRCAGPGRPPTWSPGALGADGARGRRVPRVRVRRVGGAHLRRGARGLAGRARPRGSATRRPCRRAVSRSTDVRPAGAPRARPAAGALPAADRAGRHAT